MKKSIVCLGVLAIVSVGIVAGTPFSAQPTEQTTTLEMQETVFQDIMAVPEGDTKWIDETKKSISIMCKILDDLLAKELGKSNYETKGFLSKGCNGYWLPGEGVLFNLKVRFPIKKFEVSVEDKVEEEKEKDLWDQYEEQLTGKASVSKAESNIRKSIMVSIKTNRNPFDADKVEKLKLTVIDAIAQYGNRLKGFKGDEKITVVIEGAGDDFSYTSPGYGYTFQTTPSLPKVKTREEGEYKDLLKKIQDRAADRNQREMEILQKEMEIAKQQLERARRSYEAGRSDHQTVLEAEKRILEAEKKILDTNKTHDEEMEKNLSDIMNKVKEKQEQKIEIYQQAQDTYNQVYKQALGNVIVTPDQENAFKYYGTSILGRGASTNGSVMVIQIAFKDIPAEGGDADAILDKTDITMY